MNEMFHTPNGSLVETADGSHSCVYCKQRIPAGQYSRKIQARKSGDPSRACSDCDMSTLPMFVKKFNRLKRLRKIKDDRTDAIDE